MTSREITNRLEILQEMLLYFSNKVDSDSIKTLDLIKKAIDKTLILATVL